MIHGQRLYCQAVLLIHGCQAALGRFGERLRGEPGAIEVCDNIAVMVMTVHEVLCVGLIEAVHDALNARRAEHRQGAFTAAAGPAQRGGLAEAVDMVGVEMREEDPGDSARLVTHTNEVAHAIGAGIHQEKRFSRDNRNAGPRSLRSR